MNVFNITLQLSGEELIKESNWEPVRCEVSGPFGPVVYHAVKDARGFMFLNRNEGGLNGYHETLRNLIISALMRSQTKVFILD